MKIVERPPIPVRMADCGVYCKTAEELLEKVERLRADAGRWRAMRQCYVAFDWAFGKPPISIAAFELHTGIVVAGPEGADAIADAAIASQPPATEER